MVNRESLEERLDKIIIPIMNENTPGMALLIAEGEEVILRKAYGMADLERHIPITINDNFVIASNTKQFTCLAIMMLKEKGLLDYDETIERFFPDFPEYNKIVTIRQLMNHQSGIKEYFEDDTWTKWEGAECATTEEMLEIIKKFDGLDFEPGTQYSYSNSAYVMLGNIIEQITNTPFGKFIKENIIDKVGMLNTFAPDYLDDRPDNLIEGYTIKEDGSFKKQEYDMALVGYADGNMQSNVDDMYKWHNFLYMSNSDKIMSRETMDEAFIENQLKDGTKTGYGFGFFIGEWNGHREIWHTGGTNGFISRCSRYVDDNLSVIMLTNYEGLPKDELYEKIINQVITI
ncbi:MAG: serine hydrolase [Eubacteriales bacterium]|nr:serine hydrolase [Eubacteriales bacterium]